MFEGIRVLIIAEFEGFFISHKVHGVRGDDDEHHLHDEEVEGREPHH